MYDQTQSIITDYLLRYMGVPLAILEAKSEAQSAADGMQQASRYARRLSLRFRDAPLGSMIVPLDAGGGEALEQVRGALRGKRGAALVVEYLSQAIAGGAPVPGRGPDHLTPPLRDSMAVETLEAARNAIANAFGVLPALLNPATTGPLVREAQRHLATWTLQPIAELVAEEASAKLGSTVAIDVHRPLQSFDAGGSARAVAGLVQALAQAKEAGLSDAAVAAAFGALDWKEALGREA